MLGLALALLSIGSITPFGLEYVPLVLAFAFGVVVGRWWALFITGAIVVLCIPLSGDDPLSIGIAFLGLTALGVGVRVAIAQTSRDYRDIRLRTVLVVAAYVAAGVGVRKVWNRWRSPVVA